MPSNYRAALLAVQVIKNRELRPDAGPLSHS
jgi:hypothetical protein